MAFSKSLIISTTYFPPQIGGISRLMAGIASALGPERACCLTCVPTNGDLRTEDARVRIYRHPKLLSRGRVFRRLTWGCIISEIMARESPDVVHLATATGEGAMGLWLLRWLGLPYVVYAHGNEILQAIHFKSSVATKVLLQASRVLAVSRFTGKLVQKLGVSSSRIEIVHPGCDVESYRPLENSHALRREYLGWHRRGPVIVSVGNLVRRKGHDTVIRALPAVLKEVGKVSYLVVGDGPYRSQLERLASDLGVREHVIFLGQLSDRRLPGIYSISDAFVMPSRQIPESCDVEGFGLVYLEANACGLPVVAGRSGGVPDAIEDEFNGLLVDPLNTHELSRAIVRLLKDEALAARLGRNGRERVVRKFSWSVVGRRVQQCIDRVSLDG